MAAAAGVAVGAATFYLARLLVARERVERRPPGGGAGRAGGGTEAT